MDFTPELSAFQGVIISADDVHPFSIITSKGGNEVRVRYITDKLLKFLKERNCIKNGLLQASSEPEVRKFALYMILNSDLAVLDDMVDMEGIDLVVSTIPTLSSYLMCEMFWNLHMEKFSYEVIVYSYPPLALQVAKAFVDNFKYSNPTECLNRLSQLSTACHILICRMHFFDFDGDNLLDLLTNAFENFKKCMKYITNPPNSHKLNALSKDELYKYKGECASAALQFAYDCFERYTGKQEKTPGDFDAIYLVTYVKETIKNDLLCYDVHKSSKVILDCLDNCHILLLETCKDLVMDVSVEVFCSWSEFEENGKSMQQSIGELCYLLSTKLLTISGFYDHPLIEMIQQIARKPVDIRDLINTIRNDIIIRNINKNSGDSQAWLDALVDKENLSQHIDLLQEVASHLEHFNEEQCYKLYTTLKASTENKDYIQSLTVKLFQLCNITKKYSILDELFINNYFVDENETPEFSNTMTEIFNKLVASPDADLTDVLTVFLQNPQKVYAKISSLATENSQQAEIMLRVMATLKKYCNHYYEAETEPCIIKIIQKTLDSDLDTEARQNNFIKFICGLKDANMISGTKLLLLIVMTNIHTALRNRNINSLNIQLKLWSNAYTIQELMEYRAPMLAMLGQVVDMVRWNVHTFVSHAPSALQLALLLQDTLMNTYNNSILENEGNWLKTKLKNLQPLNMYYYRLLWSPPGNNFLEIISGQTITKETDTNAITAWLTQILCCCTRQEWCKIWESLSDFDEALVLRIFHDAMTVIAVAEKANRTDNTWQCLLYCYRNLVFVIRYIFLKEPLTDAQVMAVVKNIVEIPIIQTETPEDIEALFLPLFAYFAERKNDYTIDLSTCSILRRNNLINLMNKVFVNGAG